MESYLLVFVLGIGLYHFFLKFTRWMAKKYIGNKDGVGARSRKKFLAELDHDALLRFKNDLNYELERRSMK